MLLSVQEFTTNNGSRLLGHIVLYGLLSGYSCDVVNAAAAGSVLVVLHGASGGVRLSCHDSSQSSLQVLSLCLTFFLSLSLPLSFKHTLDDVIF